MAAAGVLVFLVVSLRVQPHGHCRKDTQQPAEDNLSLDPDIVPLPVPVEHKGGSIQFEQQQANSSSVGIVLDIHHTLSIWLEIEFTSNMYF